MKRKQLSSQTVIPWKRQKIQEGGEDEEGLFRFPLACECPELPQATVQWFKRFLVPSFATKVFENLQELDYFQSKIKLYGKEFDTPRLQAWMSDDGVKAQLYQKSEKTPWSEEMKVIKEKLEEITDFQFDYVLINLYRDGADHISYHSDSESIGEGKNVIASISLGSTRKFVLRHKLWKVQAIPKREFFLDHGSLIVMKGDDTQNHWKHAVMKTTKKIGPRINLTFRHS